jgi:Disulphide bond corrector protein DsbC
MTKPLALLAALALSIAAAHSQIAGLDAPARQQAFVVYAAESQTLPANKPGSLTLHFHTVQGFHINSHTPTADYLIPTTLTLLPVPGVKPGQLQFPAGHPYSFSFDPATKLDVYSGDFIVKLSVVAPPGDHTLEGSLRYQACDNAACYPPRTLPVKVLFTAK